MPYDASVERAASILNDAVRAVAKTLQGVPGVGRVHSFLRWTVKPDEFDELLRFVDPTNTGKINAWMIATPSITSRWSFHGAETDRNPQQLWSRCAIEIHGWVSLNDPGIRDATGQTRSEERQAEEASATMFRLLCERIRFSFLEDGTLGGVVDRTDPVQIQEMNETKLGKVLCHHARMRLDVEFQVKVTNPRRVF